MGSFKGGTDKLTAEFQMARKEVFQNISKHKRVRKPVVEWSLRLYINGMKLSEDEVFVQAQFFSSLLEPGKYPMFTCTCGIFGCGGYYVDVLHEETGITWMTEDSPFDDKTIPHSHRFSFTREDMVRFAEDLLHGYEQLDRLMASVNLKFMDDLETYRQTVHFLKRRGLK